MIHAARSARVITQRIVRLYGHVVKIIGGESVGDPGLTSGAMSDAAQTTLITTSSPADLFATLVQAPGATGCAVQVFSFAQRQMLGAFTLAEPATARTCVIVPGVRPLFIAAAWREEGVGAFDVATGERVWQRKDLNRNASLVHLGGEEGRPVVGTAREDGLGWALNALTGKPVAALRTIRELYSEPARARFLTVERSVLTFRDGSTWNALAAPPLFKIPGQSLKLLDAAVSPKLVVISRPGGDFGDGRLESFTHSGLKQWNFVPEKGTHILRIVPSTEGGFVGIERAVQSGAQAVVRIDGGGKLLWRKPATSPADVPFDEGRILLTADGRALDLETFQSVWSFGEHPEPGASA